MPALPLLPLVARRRRGSSTKPATRARPHPGWLSGVAARMPVRVFLTDDVALYGAAAVAARTLMD